MSSNVNDSSSFNLCSFVAYCFIVGNNSLNMLSVAHTYSLKIIFFTYCLANSNSSWLKLGYIKVSFISDKLSARLFSLKLPDIVIPSIPANILKSISFSAFTEL